MTVSIARSRYKQMDAAAAPEIESPYKVVLVTLTELDKSLAVLVNAKVNDRRLPDDHINHCFTAIYILQSSLDFEKGGGRIGEQFVPSLRILPCSGFECLSQ